MRRSPKATDSDQGTQVTRRRREVSKSRLRVLGRAKARIIALGVDSRRPCRRGGDLRVDSGFGNHKVGTQYPNGIQVSDDQIVKPLGDRLLTQFGKIMGSTVSPNGQFLAATSTDKSVALQIFDLSDLQADLDGRLRVRGQPEPH